MYPLLDSFPMWTITEYWVEFPVLYSRFLLVIYFIHQIRSVAQSCPTLCDPMNHSTPGLPVHHQLPEFTQTHIHRVSDPAISFSVVPFSSCLQSFPASGSFPVSQFFASGGQGIGVSASASVFSVNIQDWFPLGWTGWSSLRSKSFFGGREHRGVKKEQWIC